MPGFADVQSQWRDDLCRSAAFRRQSKSFGSVRQINSGQSCLKLEQSALNDSELTRVFRAEGIAAGSGQTLRIRFERD